MELFRCRGRNRRQEIHRAAERGGAGKACRVYRRRQAVGAIADQGAHSFEGERLGSWQGWSDSRIAEALVASVANVERTRRQLLEEGVEAALADKYNPKSARPRIFDGASEAKLIALACGLARKAARGGR